MAAGTIAQAGGHVIGEVELAGDEIAALVEPHGAVKGRRLHRIGQRPERRRPRPRRVVSDPMCELVDRRPQHEWLYRRRDHRRRRPDQRGGREFEADLN